MFRGVIIVRKVKSATGGRAFSYIKVTLYDLELDLEMNPFFHAGGADFYTRTIRNTSPLKVWVNATIATRVNLSSTNRVGVFSNNF